METVSSRTQLASAHWHLVSTWRSGSFPFGRNFYSIPPSEAKLLAQWGPQFTKVPLNAWALFTDGWANEKPDGIQPQLAAMKKQNRCRCVERVELGAGGGVLPHHRHFSRLLSCHSHPISHVIMALEGGLCHFFSFPDHSRSVRSYTFYCKSHSTATQELPYRMKLKNWFKNVWLYLPHLLQVFTPYNKAVWSLNVTFSRKESYLLSYFLGNE